MSEITIYMSARLALKVPEGEDPGVFADKQVAYYSRFPQDFIAESYDSWEWEEA